MSFQYPVPNEQQSERLKALEINPDAYMVIRAEQDGLWLKHYKTGDEIIIYANSLKRRR